MPPLTRVDASISPGWLAGPISVPPHMSCKVSQRSRRCIWLSRLTARLNYLDQRDFLQPMAAGVVHGGVGHAVDLRQDRSLDGLEVRAALRGRVAHGQRSKVVLRPGVGGYAVGPAAQPGGFGGGGSTGGVLYGQQKARTESAQHI